MAQHPGPSVPILQSVFVRPPASLRQPQAPRRAVLPNQPRSGHVVVGERSNDFAVPRAEWTAEETDALLEAWCSSQGSPLITSVKAGHEKLMKILLQNGADINVSDEEGCTALHFACAAGHRNIVKVLLFTGADVDAVNHNGETPLDLVTDEKISALFARHKERVNTLPDDGFDWLSPPISPSDCFDRSDLKSSSPIWNTEPPGAWPRSAKDVDASFSSNSSSDTIVERSEVSLVDVAIEAAKANGVDGPELAMYIDDPSFEGQSNDRLGDWPVHDSSSSDISFGWAKGTLQGSETDGAVGSGGEGVNWSSRRWSGDTDKAGMSGPYIGREQHGSSSGREQHSNSALDDDETYRSSFTWYQVTGPGRVDDDITNGSPGGRQVINWKALSSGLSQRRVAPEDASDGDDNIRAYMKVPSPPFSDGTGQRPIASGSPRSQRSGGSPSPEASPRDKEEQGHGSVNNRSSKQSSKDSWKGRGGREKRPERQKASRTMSAGSSEVQPHSQGMLSRRATDANELAKSEWADPVPVLQRQPSMDQWAQTGHESDEFDIDHRSSPAKSPAERGWGGIGGIGGGSLQGPDRRGTVGERKTAGEFRLAAPGGHGGVPRASFDRISSAGRREGDREKHGGAGIMGLAAHAPGRRAGLFRSTSTDLGIAKFKLEKEEMSLSQSQAKWDTRDPLLFTSPRLRPVPPGGEDRPGAERSHINLSVLKGSLGPQWDARTSYDGREGRDGREEMSDGGGGGLLSPTPPAASGLNASVNRPLLSPRLASLNARGSPEVNRRPVTPPPAQAPRVMTPPALDLAPSRPKTSPTASPAALLTSAIKRGLSPHTAPGAKPEIGGGRNSSVAVEKTKERKVKFTLPSPPSESTVSLADLASIRPDWREAAAVGACVACGKEGCQGECIPNKAKKKVTPEVAKNLFSNAEPKTTGTLTWTRGELLGEGAYGKVFAGLNQTTGELMAVKQLKLADGDDKGQHMAALEREIALYRKMRHKHIVGYIDMERDEGSGSLYVFLEFISGGSIHSMLERFGKFSEPLVRIYTRQLLLGLEYLHSCKIIHRDIKGGNVLVDADGVIKLADFGASKAFHDATLTDGCKSIRGSVFWMAPEVIKGDGYGRRADIWSVGCTVIEMLTGTHPWPGMDNTWTAIFHIAKTTTGPPLPPDCSEEGKDFLSQCFQLDAKERPSASELLSHPFVVSVPDTPKEARLMGQQQQN